MKYEICRCNTHNYSIEQSAHAESRCRGVCAGGLTFSIIHRVNDRRRRATPLCHNTQYLNRMKELSCKALIILSNINISRTRFWHRTQQISERT